MIGGQASGEAEHIAKERYSGVRGKSRWHSKKARRQKNDNVPRNPPSRSAMILRLRIVSSPDTMVSFAMRASATALGGARVLPAPARIATASRARTPLRAPRFRPSARAYGYSLEQKGDSNSLEYRVFFKAAEDVVSPWHDIPLYSGKDTFNFVAEIPKETSAKFEAATKEPRTPIKQDVKKGKLRFYPYNINWNYGFLPQTWEDPSHRHAATDTLGDNDPVDVVEIGSSTAEIGGVYPVKILGAFAMIDEGELDWKIVAIRTDDPKANLVHDVEDVEREFPGELQKILEWFRDYKIPDGKPANQFGFNNKALNKEATLQVIDETHGFWLKLKDGRTGGDGLSLF